MRVGALISSLPPRSHISIGEQDDEEHHDGDDQASSNDEPINEDPTYDEDEDEDDEDDHARSINVSHLSFHA